MTPNQPTSALHTVYFFGSSTVFNREVPDWYTLPAQLQALLGNEYRVENRGAWGGTTSLDLQHLKQISLNPGDIVLFYGGQSEAAAVFNKAFEQAEAQRPFWCSSTFQRVALLRVSCRIDTIPPLILDKNWLSAQIQTAIKEYRRDLLAAKGYTEASHATFISILQPYLWSKPLSAYEQAMSSHHGLVEPGRDISYEAIFPALSPLVDVDLSYVLDIQRAHGQDFYLDFIHVNHIANGIIGRAIWRAIQVNLPF